MFLSPEDQALAADAAFIFSKNRIIEAVYQLFGNLATVYQELAKELPETCTAIPAKISRGENYCGLPWVMLDYPRNFSAEDMLAIRTLFWWGRHFSIHLLLKGKYLDLLTEEKLLTGHWEGWYFYTGEDPWQHHFEEAVALVQDISPEILLEQKELNGFCKISCQLPFDDWETCEMKLQQEFAKAVSLLHKGTIT